MCLWWRLCSRFFFSEGSGEKKAWKTERAWLAILLLFLSLLSPSLLHLVYVYFEVERKGNYIIRFSIFFFFFVLLLFSFFLFYVFVHVLAMHYLGFQCQLPPWLLGEGVSRRPYLQVTYFIEYRNLFFSDVFVSFSRVTLKTAKVDTHRGYSLRIVDRIYTVIFLL